MAAARRGCGRERHRREPRARRAREAADTPPHSHGASEELFFVLGGSGLAWQDDAAYEVRAGDCIVQLADTHEHTFRAGPEGLDYLVYGTNHRTEYGWLPRSRAIRLSYPWVEGRADNPWEVEAQLDPLAFDVKAERPPNIVHLDDVPMLEEGDDRWKPLGAAGGAEQTGLHWDQLGPGAIGAPPHCHSEEEEVFVILEGEGTLELWPTPALEARGSQREDFPFAPATSLHAHRRPGSRTPSAPVRTG